MNQPVLLAVNPMRICCPHLHLAIRTPVASLVVNDDARAFTVDILNILRCNTLTMELRRHTIFYRVMRITRNDRTLP